jgi:hypothetical protein
LSARAGEFGSCDEVRCVFRTLKKEIKKETSSRNDLTVYNPFTLVFLRRVGVKDE